VIADTGDTLTLRGQHHITVESLAIPNSNLPPSFISHLNEQPPLKIIKEPDPEPEIRPSLLVMSQLVKYTLHSAQRIAHDFSTSRLCATPVSVVLHNCSQEEVVIEIETQSDSASADTIQEKGVQPVYQPPKTCGVFVWLGKNGYRLKLSASETVRLQLTAGLIQPGVYNLSTLRVKVKPTEMDIEPVIQKQAAPSLIVVSRQVSMEVQA